MFLLQFLRIVVFYSKGVYKEWRFIKTYLTPIVKKACETTNYTLNKEETKKVLKYYPLLSVCANADNYALLANRKLSALERQKITLMSAMATLCDDLLDEEEWLTEDLFEFLKALQFGHPLHKHSKKALLILALNKQFVTLGIQDKYWQQLRVAFEAQANSLQQNQSNLSKEETLQISKEKNGQTSLLVASLMDENWTALQLQIIYQTGVMGQLMNDIFDTHKDLHAGIYTIVSKVKSMAELKEVYCNQLILLHSLIRELPLPKKSIQQIINNLSPINAFGMVGLHRLWEIESSSSTAIDWKTIPRKQLIFDMAHWNNRFLYLKYMKQISKW